MKNLSLKTIILPLLIGIFWLLKDISDNFFYKVEGITRAEDQPLIHIIGIVIIVISVILFVFSLKEDLKKINIYEEGV